MHCHVGKKIHVEFDYFLNLKIIIVSWLFQITDCQEPMKNMETYYGNIFNVCFI